MGDLDGLFIRRLGIVFNGAESLERTDLMIISTMAWKLVKKKKFTRRGGNAKLSSSLLASLSADQEEMVGARALPSISKAEAADVVSW